MTPRRRLPPLLAAASLSLGSGCGAALQHHSTAFDQPVAASLDRRIDVPVYAASTELEREALLDALPAASTDTDAGNDDADQKKITPALFWTGIIVGSVGTAVSIGSGIAGEVAENRLNDGYAEGLSRDRRDRLTKAGDRANALAITGAVLGVVGFGTAIVVYGIDWNRCGPVLRAKGRERRHCEAFVMPPDVPPHPSESR